MTAAAGAVLVLSAAILALRRYYARQRRCRDLLWSFAAALGEMESAIRWQRTPVLPLLEVLQTREHCGVWFCQTQNSVTCFAAFPGLVMPSAWRAPSPAPGWRPSSSTKSAARRIGAAAA